MNTYNYIIGDARDIEKIFKERKIGTPDLIITSPPYFDVKNYEGSENQIGFGQNYKDYLKDIIDIFQKCYECSSQYATFWMITDTVKKNGIIMPLPFDVNRELANKYSLTWKLKDIIIWNKTKNIPWNAKGKFKNLFEYIFFYVKDSKYKFNIDRIREITDLKKWWLTYPERYNPKGKAPSNLWEFTTPIRGWGNGYLNHFCPFPFPLVERIMSISTNENDLVFDPFAGSGSVLAVAYVMNRSSVGIDINKKYQKRFKQEVLTGAKRYWLKREKELLYTRKKIKEFQAINKRLRKNKLGAAVIQKIKTNYTNNKRIFFILKNCRNKNMLECIIISNNKINIAKIKEDEEIHNLTNIFKIELKWIVTNQRNILKSLLGATFYKYSFGNTHQYISSVTLEDVMTEKNRNAYFYSNIKLRISKTNNFFKERNFSEKLKEKDNEKRKYSEEG
jgi:DNA modification methylase